MSIGPLQYRCPRPPRCSRKKSISFTLIISRSYNFSLAHRFFSTLRAIRITHSNLSFSPSHTHSSFWFQSHSFLYMCPCDYIEAWWIIQDNLHHKLLNILTCNVTHSQVPGIRALIFLECLRFHIILPPAPFTTSYT